VVALLEETDAGIGTVEIESRVNVRRSRIEGMLKILEVEGAVERDGTQWRRTLLPWHYDSERAERVTQQRRLEQDAMRSYLTTTECRMAFLRRQLDDPADPCGRCDNCTGTSGMLDLDRQLVNAAAMFLRSSILEIQPRRRWPAGDAEPKGAIPRELQLEVGRALCRYNDPGWGRLVRTAKHDRAYGDELISAAAAVVKKWAPEHSPSWVARVPSSGPVDLTNDLARRLAEALGLEFRDVVKRIRGARPQKEMENSVQQFRNVYRAFDVVGPVSDAPVLLLDDIVDSRWTLTTVGAALRSAGSGPVYPFVLAQAVSS
jgi:ATP-dependent DNA helicase RecQ